MPAPPLAELHLHLYGCLPPRAVLENLLLHEAHADLARYEQLYEAAYGTRPNVRALLARCRAGDRAAEREFEELFVFGERDAGNFARFQAKFTLISAGSPMRWGPETERAIGRPLADVLDEEIERFTNAVWEEQRRQGVGYAEHRFLLSHAERTDGWPRALAAIERGAARAQRAAGGAPGPITRVAASLPRANPWPQWEAIRAIALGDDHEALTGVDFCHVEEGHPPEDKRAFFAAVRDHNARRPDRALAVLYHVGESFTDKSLESAVRWVHQAAELGAHRLGHAIALGIDPAALGPHVREESARERADQLRYDLAHAEGLEKHGVRVDAAAVDHELRTLERAPEGATVSHPYDAARLAEVRARQDYAMTRVRSAGAVIEVCPTSNRRIGGITDPAHHPVHRFLGAGLRVVVSSDDPGIFATTLAEEIAWVAHHCGLSADGVRALHEEAWGARSEIISGRHAAR